MTVPGTLTFLFTDLVGSTDLLTRLGDDAAVAIHHQVDDLVRAVLTQHGGREVKSLGDGLMVVFPSAVEAAAAGVEMQTRVGASGLGVSIRVGINTGEAIAEGDDYHGSAVVAAQRLCDLARGGQVLVSAVTRSLIGSRGSYAFTPLGRHHLKGLGGTTEVWSVEPGSVPQAVGGLSIPFPSVLYGPPGGRLLGREEALSRLDAAWAESRRGMRRLLFVAGEPGIGKTTVAAVWARHAHQEGAVVLAGRCAPEAVVAYQPFIEALRQALADPVAVTLISGLGVQAAELARLMPDLATTLPAPPVVRAEPGTERYLLYEAVVSSLYRLAEEAPLVLVLDDLQWADAPTVGLLEHLARYPRQGPLLVIGTYREVELARTHPLAAALVELRRNRGFERVLLRGLDLASVTRLLEAATGRLPPRSVAEAVWAETEGNPFFVEEIVAHLLESELIGTDREWPDHTRLQEIGIPEGIRQVIGRRLSRLSDAANRTLATAAVIGREFDLSLLERLSDLDEDSVVDQIDEALAARIVVAAPTGRDRYAFSHALIRQTLYEELNPTRRVRIHRRVAETLADHDGSPAELALHFTAAHEPERALPASIAAAEEAERILAVDEASRHYHHALELWEETDDPEGIAGLDRPQLLWRTAESTFHIDGGIDRAVQLAREAERLVDAAVEPLRAGMIAERLSRYLWLGRRGSEAVEAAERAIALIPSEPMTPERARALSHYAGLLMLTARYREAEARSYEAMEAARKAGNRTVEAHALVTLGTVEGLVGRVEEGLAHMLDGRQMAREERALDDIFRGYANVSTTLDSDGRLQEAVDDALEGADEAARLGLVGRYYWYLTCNAAWSLIRLGQWEQAADLLRLDEDVHADGVSEVHLQALRVVLEVLLGRHSAARPHVASLLMLIRDVIDPQFVGPAYWVAAMLEWMTDNPLAAWELAEQGIGKIQKSEDWYSRAPLHLVAVAAAVDLARAGMERERFAEAAAAQVRTLRSAEDEAEHADFPAQLAQAEAELTRLDRSASAAWRRAAEMWEQIPQPYEAAYCRFRQGEALMAAGSAAEGGELLASALEVADRLGAEPLRRMIQAAL